MKNQIIWRQALYVLVVMGFGIGCSDSPSQNETLASNQAAATTSTTIGETTVLSGTDSGNGNMLTVQSVSLSQPATIQSLSFYVRHASGNLVLGIYDDTGPSNGPGALKAQTNSVATVAGWDTVKVVTPVTLPTGNYWLAYLPSSGSLTFASKRRTGAFKYANVNFGSMPTNFPAVAGQGSTHWSIYATLSGSTDTTVPTVPTNLTAASVSTQVTLSWTASTDNVGVAGYSIYKNQTKIATVTSGTSYVDTGLVPNTSYSYTVSAYDAAGNNSAQSLPVNGGVNGTGGTSSVGGAVSTGGARSTGGAVSTGGTRSTGGAISTGGAVSTGGTAAISAIIPLDRLPTGNTLPWNPGIIGGIPNVTTKCTTAACAALELSSNGYGNGTTDATAAIQAAINSSPDGQYVHLAAGNYKVTANITIWRSNVVLRGDGPDKTIIHSDNSNGGGIQVGTGVGAWPLSVALPNGATKGSTKVTVADGSKFVVGRLVTVSIEDAKNPLLRGVVDDQWKAHGRSIGQTMELISVSGNTLELSSPLYMDFPTQYNPVVLQGDYTFKAVGIESLRSDGVSGTIVMAWSEYSWVKNVESSNVRDRKIDLLNSYRCVIRDNYVHDANTFETGGGAYGIAVRMYTSDSLVENNISVRLHFNIVFECSGGGNVVAYNYTDDTNLAGASGWLMPSIGGHLLVPHMELIEGNWASQICLDDVHGGTLNMTMFRNYSAGQNTNLKKTDSLFSASINAGSYNTNLVGNVWWQSGVAGSYESCSTLGPYLMGGHDQLSVNQGSCDIDPQTKATVLRNGNYDYVTNSQRWNGADVGDPVFPNLSHALPNSLYLSAKPSWWGTRPWPYVQPDGATKVNSLPAKDRYEAGTPNAVQ